MMRRRRKRTMNRLTNMTRKMSRLHPPRNSMGRLLMLRY
jgi:hypothetical protein